VYLFELASRHMNWVAERQAVTATNIANADTPGYRTRDTAAFSDELHAAGFHLAATSPGHQSFEPGAGSTPARDTGDTWDTSHSGNTVSIEQELMKAGANSRMMSLDAGLSRSFHRMILASLKV
jgi:flagellar basal-body rod protein FlgB